MAMAAMEQPSSTPVLPKLPKCRPTLQWRAASDAAVGGGFLELRCSASDGSARLEPAHRLQRGNFDPLIL